MRRVVASGIIVGIVLMMLLSSGTALAKSRQGGGGSSYFDGKVYGCDQTTLNTWVLPGATVTFTYWWANGILWNQYTEKTTTDSTGYFKWRLLKDGSGTIDWTAGVIVKAYMRSNTDPLSNYWTERSVLNRYWYQDMILPRDRVTYVYDMLQYSNTNYVNMILPDGYQTKVGPVTAYKALDYRGFPYASDLSWIKDLPQFTSAYHNGITGEFGKTIGSRIPFYCTGEYCPDSGYPVIDSAAIYGSQGTRQDVGVKPNYLLADPEYMPYDYAKLTKWTVDRNSARNPVGIGFDWAAIAPTLSGSVNIASMVNLNTYYYYLYHWYVGSGSQPLATKLTIYNDNTHPIYHVNCIGSVPANDPQASRTFGFRFDPTTNNVILHVWCTVGTEAMTADFSRYGATTNILHDALVRDSTYPGYTTVNVQPSANVVSGSVVMSTYAYAASYSDAHVDAWAGISMPFVARGSSFALSCDWQAWYYATLLTEGRAPEGEPPPLPMYSAADADIYITLNVYDASDNNRLVGSAIPTAVLAVEQVMGSPDTTIGTYVGNGEAWTVTLGVSGVIAGHTYLIVTSIHSLVKANGYGMAGDVSLDISGPYKCVLNKVTVSY